MESNIEIIKIPNTPFTKRVKNIFYNGACQCFNDCNCYSQKGKFLGVDERFTHPLSSKRFITLAACESSYNAKKQNQDNEIL